MRDPALGNRTLPRLKRDIVVETLAQAKLVCEVYPLVDAHGLGRRRITVHAVSALTMCSRSASPRQIRTTLFPSIAVPFSIRASAARLMRRGQSPSY